MVYFDFSSVSRFCHISPISRRTSVTFMLGFFATTSPRMPFTKSIYPLRGRFGALGSFLNFFFADLALNAATSS